MVNLNFPENFDLSNLLALFHKTVKRSINSLNVNDHINFVTDRLGHDKRYAINSSKTRDLCNWNPKVTLSDGLNKTIDYFLNINN